MGHARPVAVSVIDGYRQAWALADATLDELPLDAVGAVPWWPADDNALSLHHALVRVVSDAQRHAGHADIVRELIDVWSAFPLTQGDRERRVDQYPKSPALSGSRSNGAAVSAAS